MPIRREVLGAALTGVLAAATPRADALASPNAWPVENDDDLERVLPALSNWGRWGPDDQIGTLNLMTAAIRLDASRLIRTGRVVPLAREMSVATTPNARRNVYGMQRYVDPLPGRILLATI